MHAVFGEQYDSGNNTVKDTASPTHPTMCQSLKPSRFYFVKKGMTANKGVSASSKTLLICLGFMFRNSLILLQNLLSCLFRFLNLCKSVDSG